MSRRRLEPHERKPPILKLPFGPLQSILRRRWEGHAEDYRKVEFCVAAMAEQLATDRRMIYRWQETGVPWPTADRLAVLIGLHPSEVWGDAWWELYSSEKSLDVDVAAAR